VTNVNIAKNSKLLVLTVVVLSALAFASYWAISKNKTTLVAASTHCAAGAPNCLPALTASPHGNESSSQAHEIICAPADQNCDPRTQAARTMAYRNLRDRHAERD